MCYFPTSTSFTSHNLIMQLEAHDLLFLLWGPGHRLEKKDIQEDSGRSKEDFFLLLFFSDRSFYFTFGLGDCVGCRTSFENILLGLYVNPVTLRPSLMLISHHGQPLPAGL